MLYVHWNFKYCGKCSFQNNFNIKSDDVGPNYENWNKFKSYKISMKNVKYVK